MTSIQERETMLKMANLGHSSQEIADTIGCSLSTVRKWRQRLKKGDKFQVKWVVRRQLI